MRIAIRFLSIAVCYVLLTGNAFAFDTDPFYDQRVKQDAPPIEAVNEHIDPFSGNLYLVQTDLHLPGNGGLDLAIMRTYNSLIYGRTDNTSFPELIAKKDKSPLGIGWAISMGILRNPPNFSALNYPPGWGLTPVFELPDGTKQNFFADPNDRTRMISKDYWILKFIGSQSPNYYNMGSWEVTSPEGKVYTVSNEVAGYSTTNTNTNKDVAQVTKIQNAARNAKIDIQYKYLALGPVIDKIIDSTGRTITFAYNTDGTLKNFTYDTYTVTYQYDTRASLSGIYLLTQVNLPTGNPWQYAYDSTYELTQVTYPSGGIVNYTYANTTFKVAGCTPAFRVISQKTVSGRGITSGTWTYSYSSGGANGDVTTITVPGGTETYTYYGWGNTTSGNVWRVGLPSSKSFNVGGQTLAETFNWSKSAAAVSNQQISNLNYCAGGFLIADSGVFTPVLTSKTITRDGKSYTTNYSNYDTYGNPQTISEQGDGNRSTALTYWPPNTAKNIVKNRPATETVTGSFSGTKAISWSYDANSGNVTQFTKDGVTTSYGYDTSGNLSSVTDSNNHAISYLWSNGQISRETNNYYSISRVINPTGTVANETNGRSYTTSFGYDGNLRPTSKTPPIGNATSISYPADSSYRKETRGSYSIDYTFDGFGRPSGSSDSRGVTTTIAYTPYGSKDYEDSNIGDKVYYDYFGRVRQVVHKDTTTINYAYSNSNVTITDETTTGTVTLTYNAFGNPGEKYLMSVRDQATNTTTYTRNIQGNVTGITQGSITRSFGYDATKKNFLTSETNPETGTITYGRDNVGNLTSKSDASGSTAYGYDNINRLTSISANGNNTAFGYDNANNRTSMIYPDGSATYTYDSANRQTQKSETIGSRSYTTGYSYDGNDNITTITYPSGRTITYGYNGNNQVTSVTGFGGSVTSISYNTAGLPTSLTLSNGISSSFGYNSRNLTTSITAGSALSVGYGYDSRGNTTSYTNSLDATKNQTYGYDSLSRLTTFNGAWGSGSYAYDATGNRTTKTVAGISTSYGYSSNRVASASGGEPASYNYSGEGLLAGGIWQGTNYTLIYDSLDNLTSYRSGSVVLADFTYDGDGQRVIKTTNGNATVYHNDQAGHAISENDGNGNFLADYIYLNGKLIAKIAATPTISIAPTADSFGNGYVNATSSSHTFTISNTGSANLVIGSITFTGTNPAEFKMTTDSCSGKTLSSAASCTVQVTFSPISTGAKSAIISIPSNDTNTAILNVSVDGTGVLPILNVIKNGSGTGIVTSSPAGNITDVSSVFWWYSRFPTGTVVTLTATPSNGSSFGGWGGGLCTGKGSCVITLNVDTLVLAPFDSLTPVVNFSASPTQGSGPFIVNFTDLSQNATSWSWDFGDGTKSTLQNPSHVYSTPGSYTVTLTATNANGSTTLQKISFISVTVCQNQPVRIARATPLYYPTLQQAYAAAVDGDIIQIQSTSLAEGLTITKSITIDGGYDCGYSNKIGVTTFTGNQFTINSGASVMKDLFISQ
ncbi:choice-of-anchor D domain-containing protein [Geobacter sp.]|uniref:choice-of-anchor D domain-containing protein n=1 Tax=Geobacter sp. TaxID=46610 RepID=UPI0026197C59|nr:choice-of-anchor D domain-containing protein [Geobacter sp.]